MDPTANLAEQIRIAELITALRDDQTDHSARIADLADRLAELVTALNQWITKGGFLPKSWER